MKKYLRLLAFTILISVSAEAQVTIPDAKFVTYLQANFATCMSGSVLDTLCTAVTSATTVNCANAGITNLTGIQYFKSLTDLNCQSNSLTGLPPLPATLQTLFAVNNKITALPALPSGLLYLLCDENLLTNLPAVLPVTLLQLSCGSNPITALPATLPTGLQQLICDQCQLSALPNILPNSISKLDCSFNKITHLPALPTALLTFNCEVDSLSSLPSLPTGLTTLDCDHNQLINLPVPLPTPLLSLSCGANLFTSLPFLPSGLQMLECAGGRLTSLPTLPTFLNTFYCDDNSISSMPPLPPHLNIFSCGGNLLTGFTALNDSLLYFVADNNALVTLQDLPPTVRFLSCQNCQLTSLAALPDTINVLNLSDNASLLCLPPFKILYNNYNLEGNFYLASLNIQNTGIRCLPNVIQHPQVGSIPSVDTVPICGLFNTSGCDIAWNIYGRITNDTNSNCNTLSFDPALNPVKINLSDNTGQLLQEVYATDGSGAFSFKTSTGVYQVSVDTTDLPFTVSCPAGNLYTDNISPADSLNYSNNFAIICKPGFDVGVLSVEAGNFWTAHTTTVNIGAGDISSFYGGHCAAGVGGTVSVYVYAELNQVRYLSPAPGALTPSSVNGETITWNVPDFGALGFSTAFSIITISDSAIIACPFVCFDVSVTPTAGDNNLSNNYLQSCFFITTPQDPNYKEAFPNSYIDTARKWLTYTIHFQNTGTAPAQNIRILDTLDDHLDPATFQLLAYSNKTTTQVEGRIVQFNFPNIYLPDSGANEPGSHGYVQYKIKLKDGQPLGDVVSNTANIIFDFNAPVVTNTTTNIITADTFALGVTNLSLTKAPALAIFPNPASDKLNIQTTGFIPELVTVYDVNGRKLNQLKFASQLDITPFTSGIYFIEVKGNGAIIRNKFIKL